MGAFGKALSHWWNGEIGVKEENINTTE